MDLRPYRISAALLVTLACGGKFSQTSSTSAASSGGESAHAGASNQGGGASGGTSVTAVAVEGGASSVTSSSVEVAGSGHGVGGLGAAGTWYVSPWSAAGALANVAGSGGTASPPLGGTGPVTDVVGQDPFQRFASSGFIVTNSDGRTASKLVLEAASDGGLYVAGATRNPRVWGQATFGGDIVSEAFVVKLDDQGGRQWGTILPNCGAPADIASRPMTVYVLCPYEASQTIVLGPTCPSSAAVAILDARDGHLTLEALVKTPAAAANARFCPAGLGVSASGRLFVAGGYFDASDVERSLLISLTMSGQQDWTLLSSGATAATASLPSARPYDVDADSAGNGLFVGGFNDTMKLGGTLLTSQATAGAQSTYNGFVGRVSPAETSIVAWQFGGTVFDVANAVKPTPDGGFVIAGQTSSSALIGGRAVEANVGGSAFVARFGADGQAIWAKVVPGKGSATSVAVAADGKVHIAGSFERDELFYTYDPATDQLTSRSTRAPAKPNNELSTTGIIVTTGGSIWVAGTFSGSIDLGGGTLTTRTEASFVWRAD